MNSRLIRCQSKEYFRTSFHFYSSLRIFFRCSFKISEKNSSNGQADEQHGTNSKLSSHDHEDLDCGKPVNFTYVRIFLLMTELQLMILLFPKYDDLMGIIHRKKHKISPEPDVLFTFTTKAKSGKMRKNFDVDALEMKLRKDKRDKPRSVQLYNKIGNFWRIKGNALNSIECFRKALSINPTNSEVILNLARVLFHQGYLEDAIYLTRK